MTLAIKQRAHELIEALPDDATWQDVLLDWRPRALAMVERILDRAEMLVVAPRSGVRLKSFVDDGRRPYAAPHEIVALKRSFAACGKLRL